MNTRIYIVTTKASEHKNETVLVDAPTGASAIRFVAQQTFEARIASAKETAALIKKGTPIYDAATTIDMGVTNG